MNQFVAYGKSIYPGTDGAYIHSMFTLGVSLGVSLGISLGVSIKS
jgi:hypothetical protein